MAWETRAGTRYYYTAQRIDGKVVKRYIGHGLAGEFAESCDRQERYEADLKRARLYLKRHEERERIELLDKFLKRSLCPVETVLLAAGYHRHDRGQWRKKRQTMKTLSLVHEYSDNAKSIMVNLTPKTHEERAELLDDVLYGRPGKSQANMGFQAWDAVGASMVAAHPSEFRINATDELAVLISNYARVNASESKAVQTWTQLLTNEADALRATLAEECGGSPSPMESLLIDRIIACKIALTVTERQVPATGKPEVMEFWGRAQDRVHKRFLSAVKTLAQVRRLKIPALALLSVGNTQVNVGNQ